MNGWFAAAAGLSALTCALHVVLGGREAARPLLAADIDHVAKYTNYYCWHLVTISIAALVAAFGYSAQADAGSLALFATGVAFLFALWSLGMTAVFKLRPLQFPQWALFLPIAILGLVGSL